MRSSLPSSDASGNSSSTTSTTGAGLPTGASLATGASCDSTRPLTGVRVRNTRPNTRGAGLANDTHIRNTGRRLNSAAEPTPSSTPAATASPAGAPTLSSTSTHNADQSTNMLASCTNAPARASSPAATVPTSHSSKGGARTTMAVNATTPRPLMSRKTKTSLDLP